MNWHLLRGGVIACGLLIPAVAGATDEDSERFDWPVESFFLSEVAEIQELGTVQAQASLHLRNTPDGVQPAVLLEGEVGLGGRFQLASEVEWSREHEASALEQGVSEVGVSVGYGLLELPDSGFALSTTLDGELGLGDLSDDRWTLSGSVLAFKRVGSLGLNAVLQPGFAYTRARELAPRLELGLGASWGTGTLMPTGELYAELGDEHIFEAVGGLKFKPGELVELGVGVLVGRHDGVSVYGATTSLLFDLGD